ncbi:MULTISPECIES: hypothetical protein [unclassified Agarivorans]|uniref:hypothetical protein n=1 Tax=unclassified Agarivorans TaxID=2636026 RepID=UPI003D7C7C9C
MNATQDRPSLLIGLLLIIVGIGVIAYVLPQAVNLITLPQDAPFMQHFFSWLMADTNAINSQVSEEFFEIFQTFIKVIVLIVFLYVCLKLVSIGLLIIKEGVSLIRPQPQTSKDKN